MSAALMDAPARTEDEQFLLLPLGEGFWKEDETQHGPKHTAGRMLKNDPEKYATLRRALDGGATISGLVRSHKVGAHTLYAIIEREWGSLDQFNALMGQKFRNVANLGLERMAELIPEAKSLAEVSMATGIAFDKAAAASGTPALVVRHEHVGVNARDEMLAMIDQMKAEAMERRATGRIVEEEVAAA